MTTDKAAAPVGAVPQDLVPFGHYFRDMEGRQHFHTGATVPSFAQSEIMPLYDADALASQAARMGKAMSIVKRLAALREGLENGNSSAEDMAAQLAMECSNLIG